MRAAPEVGWIGAKGGRLAEGEPEAGRWSVGRVELEVREVLGCDGSWDIGDPSIAAMAVRRGQVGLPVGVR